jgi:hypothetical protein
MGWIALAIVACLALVVPIVVAVAASTAPVATTVAGGPKAPPAPAGPGAGRKDGGPKWNSGRGPKSDNGRQKADKLDKADKSSNGNKGQPGKAPISITAVDGSNVTLETEDGWTRTIAISDTTVITKGGVTVTAADLKVGDVIRFHQVENADGTFTVDAIRVQTPKTTG